MTAAKEDPPRLASPAHRVYAVVGLVIALGWPFLQKLTPAAKGGALTSLPGAIRTIAIEWFVTLVLALIMFGMQRQRPTLIRLRAFGWRDLLYMLAALVAAFALSGVVSAFVTRPAFDLRTPSVLPLAARVGLVLTAAICEEFIYRGFAIEELGIMTRNRWIGALVSLALFGLGHIGVYGFSSALLIPTSVGLIITLLYMFRNNLPVCMVMHATVDGLFLLVIPALNHG
jgi:membrane protease YdiL (CAAX protease family)